MKMKSIFITVTLMAVLIGCSKSFHEEDYLGKWTQVNTHGVGTMVVDIEKANSGYKVEISVPVPNQAPAIIHKTGNIENGTMKVEGFEKIHFEKNGHLKIGANEFESTK
jgi:hypothetical protein